MENYIESKDNNKIKLIRKLSQRKHREALGLTMVEGLRAVEQALAMGVQIEFIAMDEANKAMLEGLVKKLEGTKEDKIYIVKSHIFESVSDTVNSQGILAIAQIPKYKTEDLMAGGASRLLLVDHLQDPGNLGTLIRTADAAGFDGILCTKGTADAYSNKVNRAAMGSNLYLPIYEISSEELEHLAKKYRLYATTLSANSRLYTEIDYGTGYIIAVGNEANGISDEVEQAATACIHIPMSGKAESLNVAIAGAIAMYKSIEVESRKWKVDSDQEEKKSKNK